MWTVDEPEVRSTKLTVNLFIRSVIRKFISDIKNHMSLTINMIFSSVKSTPYSET